MKKTITASVLFFCVCFSVPLSARIMGFSGLEHVSEECDLVVIATPLGSRDTGESSVLPCIRPYTQVLGVETRFRPIAVLKGSLSASEFKLSHYRLPNPQDNEKIMMGPMLVSFPFKDEVFIMFLNKERDGRYAACSGQVDPAHSIRPMADRFWDYDHGYVFTYNRSYVFFMVLSGVLMVLLAVMTFYVGILLRKLK